MAKTYKRIQQYKQTVTFVVIFFLGLIIITSSIIYYQQVSKYDSFSNSAFAETNSIESFVLTSPSTGVLANLTISHPPKLGEEAQLTLRIEAPVLREGQSIKNMSAEIILPEGFALVSGDSSWSGELYASETVELTSTIRAVDIGEWTIQGKTKGAIDFLYISVSENDAFLSEKPFPITIVGQQLASERKISRNFISSSPTVVNPQPFPRMEKLQLGSVQSPGEPDDTIASRSFGGLITIKGFWFYEERDTSLVPGFDAIVCAFDSDFGSTVVLFKTDATQACAFTDSNGFFEISPILNDDGFLENGLDVFLAFFTTNNAVEVRDLNNDLWITVTVIKSNVQDGDVWFAQPPTDEFIFPEVPNSFELPAWWTYFSLRAGWDYFANQGPNFDISTTHMVTARWHPGESANFDFPHFEGTHYHLTIPPNNPVEIHLDGRDFSIGDAESDSVILHEFGHAIMDIAYFRVGEQFPITNCPSPHLIQRVSALNCAWTEGWASYVPIIVRNDPIWTFANGFNVDYETATDDLGVPWDTDEMVEGRVTAALWDMHDFSNEGLDTTSGFSLDIWDVFSNQKDDNLFAWWFDWLSLGKDSIAGQTIFHNTINFDILPPSSPSSSTSSHMVSTLSSDNTIDISWSGATDDFSGVNGYSIEFDLFPNTLPDQTLDTTSTSTTSSILSSNSWFFHVRTVDNDNNWSTNALHVGPFNIGVPCSLPTPGLDYVISSSCTLSSTVSVDKNVIVEMNAVLTILNGVTLNIDFSQFNITIKSGSGVLIKAGGKIT